MTEQTQTPTKEYKVALLTPYLTESIGELMEACPDPVDFLSQITKFGYNAYNFHGMKFITTNNGNIVSLSGPEKITKRNALEELKDKHLLISGSTESAEEGVDFIRNSG